MTKDGYFLVWSKDRPNPKKGNRTMKQNRRGRPTGYKMSDESRKKISSSMIGGVKSDETRERISRGCKERNTGAPIEIIIATDLDKCKRHYHNRYINIYIPNPVVGKPGYWMREHVVIMEKTLGRKIKPNEIIHHINEDKLNNNPNNLLLLTQSAHAKLHAILRRAKRIGG